jgi:hypothetical protein
MDCKVINNSDFEVERIRDLVDSLFSHSHEVLSFNNPPTIEFLSDPRNYGTLKKTAHYNPEDFKITIYVDGRHAKDILRSIAHELVHHHQNERGDLHPGGGRGYAQKDSHLRDMEGEAYKRGNLELFRDWEDGIKAKNPTIYNERRIRKMSLKDWKNKELNKLLMEKWGLGKKKSKKQLNEEKSNDDNKTDKTK